MASYVIHNAHALQVAHHLTLIKVLLASSAQYLLGTPATSSSFSFFCRSACIWQNNPARLHCLSPDRSVLKPGSCHLL